MGTDAAVPERGRIIKVHTYCADGHTTLNGWARVRKELLLVLREEGLLDPKTGSYSAISHDFTGTLVTFCLKVIKTGKVYCAIAPTSLGEIEMKVFEVPHHRPTSI